MDALVLVADGQVDTAAIQRAYVGRAIEFQPPGLQRGERMSARDDFTGGSNPFPWSKSAAVLPCDSNQSS